MSEPESTTPESPTPESEPKRTTPESEPIVITTKKDPKRVEQGKRLAAISREAKERKMREKIEAEMKPSLTQYIFPAIATFSTFSFFYLWFSREKPDPVETLPPETIEKKKYKKFESLG